MVNRSEVFKLYLELRSLADDAASASILARECGAEDDAEFHNGRQCAFLSALAKIGQILG